MYGYVVTISDRQYIVYIYIWYMYIMEYKIISNLDIFGYLWTLENYINVSVTSLEEQLAKMTEVFRWKLQGRLISKFSGQKTWVASVSRVPMFPGLCFQCPWNLLLWLLEDRKSPLPGKRGKPAICSRTSSMAPRSQGCKRCKRVLIQWGNCFFVWTF